MNKKTTVFRYFRTVLITCLVACSKQTAILPADASISTAVPPTSIPPTAVPTSTLIPATIIPTPLPTDPVFPVITPDSIQVERWNEYENALAKATFNSFYKSEDVVCEWVILGQTEREVYVWAYCASMYAAGPSQGSVPAVIHLAVDGSVQSAEIPGSGSAYGSDIQRMFPPDIQARIFDHSISLPGAHDHLRWRRGHPEEPPLIVLPFLPARPTQTLAPMITPVPIQVQDWKEYQTVLAQQFDYLPPEQVLCEWEFLGRSGYEIYVWAVCGAIRANRVGIEGLAIIYVREDGSASTALRSEDRSMFPSDVQEKYFNGLIRFQELVDHLHWRQSHPEELPLIVLSSTPTR